jgi:hypothetical protein
VDVNQATIDQGSTAAKTPMRRSEATGKADDAKWHGLTCDDERSSA